MISPSSFKLQVCWLHSLTRITYSCKLIGILSLAAFLQFEIYWGYVCCHLSSCRCVDCLPAT
ncbi:hypothetical protein CBW52_04970 [Yersinia kristensenii]|uniref:Uncharacterized protein n=1 Tax=Yersinia kristensenii TaxID=28152 RepID=A0AB73QDX1_YERKR|nr:hypothetical protein CBW52_04970 [Yersinia kristensenii]